MTRPPAAGRAAPSETLNVSKPESERELGSGGPNVTKPTLGGATLGFKNLGAKPGRVTKKLRPDLQYRRPPPEGQQRLGNDNQET